MVRVFAYGSNLCLERIAERAPSARVIAVGALAGHSLRWHKKGRDGSGKCDAFATGDARDVVHGAVYEMSVADKAVLDRIEGLGEHYFEKTVTIATNRGDPIDAIVYFANPRRIDETARPSPSYKKYVTTGARQHHLPPDYIATLDAAPTRGA